MIDEKIKTIYIEVLKKGSLISSETSGNEVVISIFKYAGEHSVGYSLVLNGNKNGS